MKLQTILFLILLACPFNARSSPQEQTITGTVTDAITGEPLPGVNVIIEGTVTGTSTDLKGKYSINRPAEGSVLSFSFIGYTTGRLNYTGQPVVDIQLTQTVTELDQVVVIGYGTIKKSDLTGSIAQVSSKEIEKFSPVNIQSALQGKATGLMVAASSGGPASNQ